MKKRLFIIGAGGLGRQLETYLELIPEDNKDWDLTGYIDDHKNALVGKGSHYQVLGDITSFKFDKGDMVLLAIADLESKIKIVESLQNKVEFFSYVSGDALIGKNVTLGKGCVVCPGSKIGSNVTIGDFSLINLNSIIGHDSILGEYCSIMPRVDIGGGNIIGSEIFMGTKVTVAPYLSVVSNTYLGVGAVIIKNIAQPGTYFGNPARRML